MSFLDKMGKLAMDALGSASRVAGEVQQRIDPLIERSELAKGLRDRLRPDDAEPFAAPDPESNESPFQSPSEVEPDAPLGDPDKVAQVYGNGTDPWTGRALQLLTDREIEHDFVDLESEGGAKLHARLLGETRDNDGPYVYLRGEHIGGFNALNELDRLGQLEERVKPEAERQKRGGRIRIVVPKRGPEARPAGEIGNPDDRK